MSTENRILKPELIAEKLDKARNYELPDVLDELEAEPRLVEMLWFLQWVSLPRNYAGGLARFASDLVSESMDFLTTPTMKANAGKPYTDSLKQRILNELPPSLRWDRDSSIDLSDLSDFTPVAAISDFSENEEERAMRAREARNRETRKTQKARERMALHARMQEADVLKHLAGAALVGLVEYLQRLCETPEIRFRRPADDYYNGCLAPKHFARCAEAILRFMDRWKVTHLAGIAETEITRQCFAWMEKAIRLPGRGIMLEGNSRFGKTDAVRAWCQAHPGRARFVRTPPAGGEAELLREVAIALGLERSFRYRAMDLRAEIEFVLRHSGLMLIFDESQFIFPSTFGKNTQPARLNWIRCNLLDTGVPVVFIFTPQSYRSTKSKFVKATGFAIEQFEGRIIKHTLPSEVSREDLLSIARIHFPGVAENCIEWTVSLLAATERNYVSDVSNVATLAFFNAEQGGRSIPKLADIKAAIADVLPPADPAALPASEKTARAPDSRSARPSETDFQRTCTPPAKAVHDRSTRPADALSGAVPLERFDAAAIDLASPP